MVRNTHTHMVVAFSFLVVTSTSIEQTGPVDSPDFPQTPGEYEGDLYLLQTSLDMNKAAHAAQKANAAMVSSAAGVSVLKLSKASCSEGPFESRTSTAPTATIFAESAAFVDENNMTFLEPQALAMHRELIEGIEQQGVPGVIVETGVAAGGSALVFTSIKRKERCIHLYDTFEGMPPPSAKDGADVYGRYAVIQSGGAGDDYYGYNEDLLSWVKGKFEEAGYPPETNGVDFHKGLFEDEFNPNFEIAYAHLDGDWYESTYVVLDRATPKMALNGIIVLDDTKFYSGAADAVNDFFGVNATGVPDGESMNVSKSGKTFQINQQARMYIKRLT